jgi:hypothetical protein
MLTDLPSLVAQAPADATLVIYHTSALWYLPAGQREQFASTVRGLGATWLSSEPPGVVPGTDGPARDGHTCVLARDGDVIALTESPRDMAAVAALTGEPCGDGHVDVPVVRAELRQPEPVAHLRRA